MGTESVLIVGGWSFIYFSKNKSSRNDPWGTPCFVDQKFEKRPISIDEFISFFFCV
jgi:hypothetical protein